MNCLCKGSWRSWWKMMRMQIMNDMKRLERLVMVSIWCIQEDLALRPTMRKVTQIWKVGLNPLHFDFRWDTPFLCDFRISACPNLVHIELSALNLKLCCIDRCSQLRLLQDCPLVLFQKEGLPSNLHELEIRNCNQLTPQVDWGLQRLASLTRLSIECGCEDVDLFPNKHLLPSFLTSLQGLQQLTSLLKLEISSYPEPHCFAGSVFQHPISLKVLRICDCPRLQSLRELGFQQLTSLVELGIIKCCELQSLTEVGLQHLTSLEKLNIQWCSKLQYLTKQRLPDSLSYLHVYDCPSLEQRCQFEKGLEWCYIAHSPKIVINEVLY
ncbi:hypothetical protein AAG906_022949 [Vitis piasezkii]